MIRIPGTSWEVQLVGKTGVNYVAEVSRRGTVHTRLEAELVDDFSDAIEEFLNTQGLVIPKNRLATVIEHLDDAAYELDDQEVEKSTRDTVQDLMRSSGAPRKILLMGLNSAGKTSIYETVFEGKQFSEIYDLPPTRGIERKAPELVGEKKKVYIWDVGGQQSYLKKYHDDPEQLFEEVSGVVFVVDGADPERLDEARDELEWVATEYQKLRRSKNLFVFLHKIDLLQDRQTAFKKISEFLLDRPTIRPRGIFPTTVLDESIYNAWAKAMETILPKSSVLNVLTQDLKERLKCYNVLVLEKRTGLPLCSSVVMGEDDDILIPGLLNKLISYCEKIASQMDLINLKKITIELGNGVLYISEILEQAWLMITSASEDFLEPATFTHVTDFVNKLREYL